MVLNYIGWVGMATKCPKCKSIKTNKYGWRAKWLKGHKKMVQAYLCNNCGHQWRDD
jgi:DNA-directed RNA polymerase subunit M/transcription elongation factor TFIIS